MLNDSVHKPRFIETLPKMGYRFIGQAWEVAGLAVLRTPRRPRVLVLPFANLTSDPAKEYFSDAMTEEIIGALAALAADRMAVLARTTAMHYKGTQKDAASIGSELSIDYIVEGSVRLEQDGFAVNLQLVQVSDQSHLWATRYEAKAEDVFRIHREAAQAIAARIGMSADNGGEGSRRMPRQPTENLAAYNVYLQGRAEFNRMNHEGILRGKQCFEEAIERDPQFALAHEALADLYWYAGFFGFAPPKKMFTTGIFEAIRAVTLDFTLGEAHSLLGMYRKQVDYDWSEVAAHVRRALELNPTSPVVRLRSAAFVFLPAGRMEEAAAEMEYVLEVDPLWVFARGWLSCMYWLGRQYGRGLEQARLMIEINPAYYMGYFHLAVTSLNGDLHTGVENMRRATELSGNSPLMLGWLSQALARSGDTTEARAILEGLTRMVRQTYVPPTGFAWIHLALGDIDEGFRWLDRAVDGHDPFIVPFKTYPFLDPIRSDPRYHAILKRIHLEP